LDFVFGAFSFQPRCCAFTGTGYHGVNHMTMEQGGKQMNMTVTFDSKYPGAWSK
jgi:hypothetical protein